MRILPLIACFVIFGCGAAHAGDAVPVAAYFPVLPFDAPPDAEPQLIPLAANHQISGPHEGITRAIIVIHDESRDAAGALTAMSALAGTANETTMILAPQFMLPSDLARFADHLPEKGHAFASWQMAGWPSGDDAAAMGQKGVSSFTVADLLLMYLADREAFPDLHTIIVAGYGAGAVFAQRYAAFAAAADIVAQQNIDLRFVAASAPSYLYLTASRPLGGMKGFGLPDVAACPDFNAYPYGLDRLNPYARRIGANQAKIGYGARFVTYLTAQGDAAPDNSCAAKTQGADGNARLNSYRLYLQSIYSDVAARTQVFAFAKDAKNDAVGLFGSACGMASLFGDGLCPASP